jgi:hypothetical protein
MTRLATDTIVLIHGLWMTPLAWEHDQTSFADCAEESAKFAITRAIGLDRIHSIAETKSPR